MAGDRKYFIRKKWHAIQNFVDNRPQYQRILIFFVCFVGVYLAWYIVIYSPVKEQKKSLLNNINIAKKTISTLRDKGTSIVLAANKPLDKKLAQEKKDLIEKIAAINQQLKVLDQEMIPPEKMADVLREMLSREKDLRLVQLRGLEPQPLFNKQGKDEENAKQMYVQGLVLVFDGDYFHTLDYLKRIESLQWSLFWDQLDYNVVKYPEARVTIRLHTLVKE